MAGLPGHSGSLPDHELLLRSGRLLSAVHVPEPGRAELRSQQHLRQCHYRRRHLRRHAHQPLWLLRIHPAVPGHLYADRQGRRFRRYREVQQGGYARPVRDAHRRYHPLPVPARCSGRPEVHVRPRLCGCRRLHFRGSQLREGSGQRRRPDVLLPVSGYGRHGYLRLLPG